MAKVEQVVEAPGKGDMLPKNRAPTNDGLVAPSFARPTWIDHVAIIPAALDAAKAANQAAMDAAATAEAKAARLVQVGLALLTIAFGVGAYQLTFALKRSSEWLPTLLPVGVAIICLALAVFETVEIDRVGFYRQTMPGDFDGAGPGAAPAVQLEVEEIGRHLARWTANHKISDLMQARAWLSRGLAALVVAALLAGICRGTSTSSAGTPAPASPPTTVSQSTR